MFQTTSCFLRFVGQRTGERERRADLDVGGLRKWNGEPKRHARGECSVTPGYRTVVDFILSLQFEVLGFLAKE